MKQDFFSEVRILDGGMGQNLIAKGLITKGSLWSATALIDKKYHQLVVDSHLDFINSGAEVIVTTNFPARRERMIQNNVEKFRPIHGLSFTQQSNFDMLNNFLRNQLKKAASVPDFSSTSVKNGLFEKILLQN